MAGNATYPGHDDWVNVTMHAGDTLAMGEPHTTGFATTEAAIHSCGDSAKATAAGLQINVDPKYGPRSTYGLYTFTKDTEVAYCPNTSANPSVGGKPYGAGGLPQYYIPDVTKSPDYKVAGADPRFTRTGQVACGP